MSKETIPQSIIDEIVAYIKNLPNMRWVAKGSDSYNMSYRAAEFGYGLSEGRIKELEADIERLEKIIDAIPIIK